MFDNFTWRRGSGETDVIGKFADLPRKASEEAHSEVMVVLHFPQGYLTVVTSTPEHPAAEPHHDGTRARKGIGLAAAMA